MTSEDKSENLNPVSVVKGDRDSNILVSIPHGSPKLTRRVQGYLREDIKLTNNDWFLNDLYSFLKEMDITSISANYSRYVIDVNRKVTEKSSGEDYTQSLIYDKNTFNHKIYAKKIEKEEIEDRINKIYRPFHKTLVREIKHALEKNPKVYLLDLHSFYIHSDADIVLGTREGRNCSQEFLKLVYGAFLTEGFKVKIDEKGLKGGYIVTKYSQIEEVEAIQVEIRYTQYIENRYFGEEEISHVDRELFNKTQRRLIRVFEKIKNSLGRL